MNEQELKEMGVEISPEMKELMDEISSFGVIAGDVDAAWEVLGNLAESEEYQEYLKTIAEAGGYMPEEFANAILDNQEVISNAVRLSYDKTQETFNDTYGQGFDVVVPVNAEIISSGMNIGMNVIPHAHGGIFDKPHLGLVAEAGYPESIIPINRSPEALDLWLKTGELLGMDGLTGGEHPLADDIEEAAYSGTNEVVLQIDNSKVIMVHGDLPTKEFEEMLESEDEKFAQMMERYLSNNRRTRFY